MPNETYPKLGLGSEVDSSSKMFDLAKSSLQITLFQEIMLELRDLALDIQVNSEYENLQKHITESLDQRKGGYLLEVSIYTNENGQISLPYGQLLLPIGIGTEPVDAYAEFLRDKQFRPLKKPIIGFKNNSFFLWIDKGIDNNMQAWTIPSEFRTMFIELAINESDKRINLSKWIQIFPDQQFESISRAEYWKAVENSKITFIEDIEKRAEISALTHKMNLLETRVNNIFHNYQALKMDLAKQNKYTKVLEIVSAIADIYKAGIELGKVIYSQNESPVTGDKVEPPLTYKGTAEIIEQRKIKTQTYTDEIRRKLKIEFQILQETDLTLNKRYEESKIAIPLKEIKIPDLL